MSRTVVTQDTGARARRHLSWHGRPACLVPGERPHATVLPTPAEQSIAGPRRPGPARRRRRCRCARLLRVVQHELGLERRPHARNRPADHRQVQRTGLGRGRRGASALRRRVARRDPAVERSGAAGSPITYTSYPSTTCSDRPSLAGTQPITDWAVSSGSIWVATLSATTCPNGINQLFRNGTRLPLGRWPNAAFGPRRPRDGRDRRRGAVVHGRDRRTVEDGAQSREPRPQYNAAARVLVDGPRATRRTGCSSWRRR
jgi:hypothetical protein